MRVLLLGNGGREHAIGWKLAQSPDLSLLISAPGNPGLAEFGPVVTGFDINNPEAVTALAVANQVDLVVVGPEAPLAAGVVDSLLEAKIPTCGPARAGAQLEASKAYAKDIMARAGVPTADAQAFTDVTAATEFLASRPPPFVVKADGLAAGKGVLVTEDLIAAQSWARICIEGHFGDAGSTVVVEDYLLGPEVSIFVLTDGKTVLPLAPARDYKRLEDGNDGPNTGGMGTFSPLDGLPEGLIEWTVNSVVHPVLDVFRTDEITYRGFIYVGLVLTADGPKVLEFNSRLGDPETQVVLPLLDDDLLGLLAATADGELHGKPLAWLDQAAVDVVIASEGYPEKPLTGRPIDGLDAAAARDDALVFQAGTRRTPTGIVSSGGRVLNIVGTGPDITAARAAAYAAVEEIELEGMQYRKDIAL
ncbi:MAG: phosphoribosylamine--glycine ligase [Acidimicrobiia bacterium]|nr:phosphoribosylamine--glycine ligase [Acidimicrobiia bacterium]